MQLEHSRTRILWLLVVFVNGKENTTPKTSRTRDGEWRKNLQQLPSDYFTEIYKNAVPTGSNSPDKESYSLVTKDIFSPHDSEIPRSKIRDSRSPRDVNTELSIITKSDFTMPSVTKKIRAVSTLTGVNKSDLAAVKLHKNEQEYRHLNRNFAEDPFSQSRKDMNTCHDIRGASSNFCPEGFNMTDEDKCIIILEKQKFPLTCPYPNCLAYILLQIFADKYLRHDSVWIPAFRNLSNGFPDFQWTGPTTEYYHDTWHLNDNIDNSSKNWYNNCAVRKNGTSYAVSCSEEHTLICMYSFNQLIINVGERLCHHDYSVRGDFCFMAHYDLRDPTCFCKKSNKFQPPKNNYCVKLAEPILPHQTQLMIKAANYYRADKCWIGLKKEVDTYKWSSTYENVNYTQWAKPSNCKFSEGALMYSKKKFAGWTLEKDRTLDCAFCEIKKTPKIPRLHLYLHYENHYNSLVLYLEHQYSITGFYTNYDVHCFSDENENGFKTHVKTSPIDSDSTIYTVAVSRKLPSHYWCEATQVSSYDLVKSDVVVTHWMFDYVHEFSIHIKVNVSFKTDSFINHEHLQMCKQIKERINGSYDVESVRPMRVYFDENTYYANMIFHVSIAKTKSTPTEEHLRNLLTNMSIVTDILSSRVCPLASTNTTTGLVLEWPETPIGATAIPSNRLCLDEEHDMLPVTRKCEGDFLNGGKWQKTLGSCFENTTYSETSKELFSFLNQNISAETLIDDLLRITGAYTKKQSIDIHLIAQNLEKLDFISKQINVINYSRIVSNIMYFDKKTLRQAQMLLNSTDKILSSLDNLLNNENYSTIVSPRLITQIIDLNDTNVTGIALYKETPGAGSFKHHKFSLLFKNTSVGSIISNKQLQMAVILPAERIDKYNTSKLVVTVFYNDRLFHEGESDYDLAKIISVSTPDIMGHLRNPIRIYFKTPEGRFKDKKCTFWDYGISRLSVSIHGHWKMNGSSKTEYGLVELCEFYHMTHFGHLLKIEVQHHELPLEIITAIGSALSLIGIIPIYATAIFFKKWRKRPGNILLLNFCTAITLQIVLTFLFYAIENDGIFCKTIGALMHYSILSEFCWMLVIAILQYKRYVVVLKPRKSNVLKKSLLVGWGTPLFPILVALWTTPTNYKFSEVHKFCYITGYYFYFGLVFPVVLILSINGIIFGIIIYNISQSNVTICVERSRDYKREILLAFLLFFILGFSWLFGLFGILGVGDWVTYIFCLTATLRGLILFMYFIFGNKETRLLWKVPLTHLRYKIMLLKKRC